MLRGVFSFEKHAPGVKLWKKYLAEVLSADHIVVQRSQRVIVWLHGSGSTNRMNAIRSSILLILYALFVLRVCIAQDVFLWPQPQVISSSTRGPLIVLSENFKIDAPDNIDIRSAATRYTRLIKRERWLPLSADSKSSNATSETTEETLASLNVMVVDLSADLQHGVDESYELTVDSHPVRAVLFAKTVWGAMRGLETFSQLIRRADGAQNARLVIGGRVNVVKDFPLYPHRGVLLDVSRNFYPVRDIERTIRALSYNKLNVLHLHLTDSQSFPVEIESEPALSREGSYGLNFVYSKNDIKGLISYGRKFGVRIVPEIDTPGHALSWGGAYPEIVTCRNKFWSPAGVPWADRFASEPGAGQLNPLLPKTYEVVKNVITDVASLFPDDWYHAGGDEIAPGCWMDDALVREYINSSSDHSLGDLLAKFITETRPFIDVHNKTVVYWEDVLLDSAVNISESVVPKKGTILQTWNNGPLNTKQLTAAGYQTIVSSSDFYYLDCGRGGFVGNDSRYDQDFNDDATNTFNYGGLGGSWCAPFKTWARIYDYDITANLTFEEAALVLGGEVALWSEQADASVLDARLWPRSSGLAEAMWSGNRNPNNSTQKRYAEAIVRLNEWRYRMVHRGIGAEPLQPMWCLKNPEMCNL